MCLQLQLQSALTELMSMFTYIFRAYARLWIERQQTTLTHTCCSPAPNQSETTGLDIA